MNRRALLATAGTLVPLAGCASLIASDGDRCSPAERFSIVDEVETGQFGGFTLTVDPSEVIHGETIAVQMRNASEEERVTGNRQKFTIHRDNAGEWQSVYAEGEGVGWNDIGIQHDPGEGFTWNVTVSQSGFSDAPNHLDACAAVRPGDYRFVYWGSPARLTPRATGRSTVSQPSSRSRSKALENADAGAERTRTQT